MEQNEQIEYMKKMIEESQCGLFEALFVACQQELIFIQMRVPFKSAEDYGTIFRERFIQLIQKIGITHRAILDMLIHVFDSISPTRMPQLYERIKDLTTESFLIHYDQN